MNIEHFFFHPRSGMGGVCVNLEADIMTVYRTYTDLSGVLL